MYTYETNLVENQQDIPVLGVVSIWFGVFMVGITAVSNIIAYQSGGVSGATAVAETFRIVLFALILASIVYMAWQTGSSSPFFAAMPFLINLFTLIIIQFVPFAAVWEEINFQVNFNRYKKVIDLVESGQLPVNQNGSTKLPTAYQGLSHGGQIMAENQNGVSIILFISARQSATDVEGYLYRSDGQLPHDEFGGNWRSVVEKRPFWFYCARHE